MTWYKQAMAREVPAMPRTVTTYNIFLASPNELCDERDQVDKIIGILNDIYSTHHTIELTPIRWERHVYPDAGRPQAVINAQIGKYDIFIGMMWKWYGMAAGARDHEEESGTAEEFRLARQAHERNPSMKLFFYFVEEPFWPKSKDDIDQLKKVFSFRKEIERKKLALVRTVKNREDLSEQVRHDLELYINELIARKKQPPGDKPTAAEDQRIAFRSIEMLVDLSTREQLTNMNGFDLSKTTKRVTATVKSADEETRSIRFRHATQGHCIKLLDESLQKYWKRSGTEDPSVYAPSLEHLQEDERFKELRDLKGRLDQSYYLDVPYDGPNQEISYSIEIYNGYQPSNGDWTGIILIGDVDKCELKVRFPTEKDPRDFVTRKGDPTVKDSFHEVHGNQKYTPDSRVFEWKFSDGKRGEAYELSWKW